ncbi:complex I NDUFA9 subunit family protein [Albimonas sp. CAU 1670]|uniref:complex I NDUFA9 subunit family protein n=1 Tax=Albimonas sp. CAU 1670 TaxID=3032599 RepID=UPI0023DAAA1E|nr:complex I NDUFA9 subunit family protein [Albimonas sp. CAU 1670]MDF2233442.1 complex I NDUFA9 subunit family protein [Albimonas sp. CAU 1670]
MTQSAPLVTIFGGSGFVGRYVAQRMARRGWRVRAAVRRPNEAMFLRPYGDVGQVEPVQANIRDDASVAKACLGADAVINCVGILAEAGKQSFESVQAQGAARVAKAAAEAGVKTFVQISAIGADAEGPSDYARTKAAGEKAVLDAFPDAVILRPSVIFGMEDEFFNRFAGMARISPVLPIVGGETRLQPVYVADVAEAAARAACGEAAPGIYELGGPEAATLRELLERMLKLIRRRRLIVDMPAGLAGIPASILSTLQSLSGGLYVNRTLTSDMIAQLGRDNVVADDARTFADLGIEPTAMEAILESYLYAYRPQGQYSRLTESAKNMRGA